MSTPRDGSTSVDQVPCGGIVLLGGSSSRMGSSKALLPFGAESMCVRVAGIVGSVARPLILVGAVGQQLAGFPADCRVAYDRMAGRGPLEGIAAGLRAVADHAESAFVAGCDLPLLRPAFIRRMIELSAGFDVCLPSIAGRPEPLAAVYHVGVLPEIEFLLRSGRLRPAFLLERVETRRVTAEELRDVDPDLLSLTNVNDPVEYRAALEKAGIA
ncbi:MAG: molybdenum cofactor guanylyltransferase [Thermoguttaceae bacterium]